jgi:hypothetical protein
MERMTIVGLLERYEGWVKEKEITFLQGEDAKPQREKVLSLLDRLKTEVARAEAPGEHALLAEYIASVKAGTERCLERLSEAHRENVAELLREIKGQIEKTEGRKDRSRNLIWYKAHQAGRELWELLASTALNHIDPGSKGNQTLFEFVKAASAFEDLLYGLEEYYRDHTLHSLWVYLIGEYILRELLPDLHDDLNWYLYNDIEGYEEFYSYPDELVVFSLYKHKELVGGTDVPKSINSYRDATWCVIALCHDLGYSLEKLKKLNRKVEAVLGFFDVPDFRHVGYSLDIEHQYLVAQFLELMAMDVRIAPSEVYRELKDYPDVQQLGENEQYKKLLKSLELSSELDAEEAKLVFEGEAGKKLEEGTLIKCYRDDSTYWRLCRALEKKQHGILGAYLVYKVLGVFADTFMRGSAEEWGLEDEEVVDNIVRGDILFAIAQHTFDFAHLSEFNSLADVLMLADELEEFSRYGRQLQSREYHDTMAWSSVEFEPKVKEGRRAIKKEKGTRTSSDKQVHVVIKMSYEVPEKNKREEFIDFCDRKAKRMCRVYSLHPEEERRVYKRVYYRIERIDVTMKYRNLILGFRFGEEQEGKKQVHRLTIEECHGLGDIPVGGDVSSYNRNERLGEYELICHDDKLKRVGDDMELASLLKEVLPSVPPGPVGERDGEDSSGAK